jgi:hypothetical protein
MADMKASLHKSLMEERSQALKGLLQGVNEAIDKVPSSKAAEWDKYYANLALWASIGAVAFTAFAAIPAAAAGATVILVSTAGELGCLRIAAVGGLGQVVAGAAGGMASYEQGLGRPDFNPEQGMINSMKDKIITLINDEDNNNRDNCRKLLDGYMRRFQNDLRWRKAFTGDDDAAEDARQDLIRTELYGKARGYNPINAAKDGAKDACESLFKLVVTVYPKYQSEIDWKKLDAAVEYQGGTRSNPYPERRPPTPEEGSARLQKLSQFRRKYPTFFAFLEAQSEYAAWKRNRQMPVPGGINF